MKIKKLAKDATSGLTGCPTVYLGEEEHLVVQADLVDDETAAAVEHPLPGEAVVQIRREVVEDAVRRLHQEPQ